MQKILLHPLGGNTNQELRGHYLKAVKEASELFIVSAYLTDWEMKVELNKNCKELSFIVGTDFGITKKEACKKVLNWLPGKFKGNFMAADHIIGFHPKTVIWKDHQNKYHAIIGSSNLTQAAFQKNYEANILVSISSKEYKQLKQWVYEIQKSSSPVSEDWLKFYEELERSYDGKKLKEPKPMKFVLPKKEKYNIEIMKRRKQQKAFKGISKELKYIIRECGKGRLENEEFFERFYKLWGKHDSRFQGNGFQIKGKNGDWSELCGSLNVILQASRNFGEVELDNIVRKEIDELAISHNPNRKAIFSELLCHFFPDKYPLINKPVHKWLSYNKYRAPRNSSEGATYIDLSIKLRRAINFNKSNKAKNLAELDVAIWEWYSDKFK